MWPMCATVSQCVVLNEKWLWQVGILGRRTAGRKHLKVPALATFPFKLPSLPTVNFPSTYPPPHTYSYPQKEKQRENNLVQGKSGKEMVKELYSPCGSCPIGLSIAAASVSFILK